MTRSKLIRSLLAGAGLLLAGCGSSSSDSSTAVASVGGKQATGIALANCMRGHGVTNFPDPGGNGHGGLLIQASQKAGSGASMTVNGVSVAAPAFRAAMLACRADLPNSGHPTQSLAAARKAALQMARCMRSHGLPNFPDPTVQSGPSGGTLFRIGPGSGADPNSPAFKAAQKICQPQNGLGGP